MRAYRIDKPGLGINSLQLTDVPDLSATPGHVIVELRAASINYRDLMILDSPAHPTVKENCILLSDGAGTIVSLGEGVKNWNIGDRVAGAFYQTWYSGKFLERHLPYALGAGLDGVLAERVLLSASGIVRIPDHMSFEEASTLPCAGVTAWHALTKLDAELHPGNVVLTLGTGGVSLFALQLAKIAGLAVVALTSSTNKVERLHQLGADYVIDSSVSPEWALDVKRLIPQGVDHVVEVIGNTLPLSLQALKIGGTISIIGSLAGEGPGIQPLAALQKSATFQSIRVGSVAMFEALINAITLHRIAPIVDRVFQFEEASDALEYARSGNKFGKVVIAIGN